MEEVGIVSTEKSLVSATLLEQVMELVLGGQIVEVTSDEECERCIEIMRRVKATAADLETERKSFTQPHTDANNLINGEYKPLIRSLIGDKEDSRGGVAGNLSTVTATWQMKKEQKAADDKKKADEAAKLVADAEKVRLANIAQQKIEEEEKLRNEAALETDETKKAELEEKANLAVAEAIQAESAITEVVAVPVEAPKVFPILNIKTKMEYTAKVVDHRKAMEWIVKEKEWGHIESAAFKKCIQGAMDKIAKNKEKDFSVPGCELISTPVGK